MNSIPSYLPIAFGATVLLTIYLFARASRFSKPALSILIAWIVVQSAISLARFYIDTSSMPPRLLFAVVPAFVSILILFATNKGRQFLDTLTPEALVLLHVIRIPVELILHALYQHKAIPVVMTFEGRNFDIISGISALVIYLLMKRKMIGRKTLIAWNVICIGLLINIVAHAVLAVPYRFQQISFDQPNVGVLYFPYLLLPAVVVPLVLLSHLASLRMLFRGFASAKIKTEIKMEEKLEKQVQIG
jgi:hypothetical protein